jgi:hypothetical protein
MIRIMTATNDKGTKITVDGEVTGEYVDVIETVVKQASGRGGSVHLFLRDVSTIDELGRALLSRLASKGFHLSATGVYSSYVVAEIRRSAAHKSAA